MVIADLGEETGKARAQELGDGVLFAKTDVSSEEDGQNAVKLAVEKHGGLNILVNCAGIGGAMKIVSSRGIFDLKLFDGVVRINLIGTFNMLRLSADAMSKGQPNDGGERGVIINTSSVAAFEGQIGQAAYAASKAGIAGLTLPAARELARQRAFVFFSEPTWGIDLAGSSYIYGEILEMRAHGAAILLISTDLDEVLTLADSIGVMHRGRLVASMHNRGSMSKGDLGRYMLGVTQEARAQGDGDEA